MTTSPTGDRGKALGHLRAMLAAASALQTWVSAEDADGALEHIYIGALPPPAADGETGEVPDTHSLSELAEYRPLVVVGTEVYERRKVALGTWAGSGTIAAYFEQAVPSEIANDPDEVETRWANTLDGILAAVEALSETAGYLSFDSWKLGEPLGRCDPTEIPAQGDHQFATVRFDWGEDS